VTRSRTLRWAPLAGIGSVGVMAGHWLAYVAGVSGSGLRSEILAQTGHSYWQFVLKVVALMATVGLGAVVARRTGRRWQTDSSRVERWSFVATRLIVLQVIGFCGMETAERVAVGAPLSGMFAHRLLLLGLAFQVLTAVVGALLLTGFERGVVRVVRALRGRRRRPAAVAEVIRVPFRPVVIRRLVVAGAAGPRSPPRS